VPVGRRADVPKCISEGEFEEGRVTSWKGREAWGEGIIKRYTRRERETWCISFSLVLPNYQPPARPTGRERNIEREKYGERETWCI
jgi:hypothetical protein